MRQFIEKYRERINGVLTGFDRLVFRGSLRRLNFARYDKGLNAMVANGSRSPASSVPAATHRSGIWPLALQSENAKTARIMGFFLWLPRSSRGAVNRGNRFPRRSFGSPKTMVSNHLSAA
jgi:hypothetical protein